MAVRVYHLKLFHAELLLISAPDHPRNYVELKS